MDKGKVLRSGTPKQLADALTGRIWQASVMRAEVEARRAPQGHLDEKSDVPLDDLIDIGVVDANGDAVAVEKKRIAAEESTFTMTVDKRPVKARIDPLNKLIDRRPGDNAIVVGDG